jgi:hypothetical protein
MAKKVNIQGLPFMCVRLEDADFDDVAAIYVIICVNEVEGKYTVIDVGQSGQVGTRINNHDREECWHSNCEIGHIWVCIYKTPTVDMTAEERIDLEGKIRDAYPNLPCGER